MPGRHSLTADPARHAMPFVRLVTLVVLTAVGRLAGLNLTLGNKQIDVPSTKSYSVGEPQFLRAFRSILAPALAPGNKVIALVNGHQIFPPKFRALANTNSGISIETYIYWLGTVGGAFSDAFTQAARCGVQVKVLLGWVDGSPDGAQLSRIGTQAWDLTLQPTWSAVFERI